MLNLEISKIISLHASVVLTGDVLRTLERAFTAAGWELSSIDVVTRDGHEAKCDSVADVLNLPAHIWKQAVAVTAWARVPGEGFANLSRITFRKPRWYVFEKPITIHIRSRSEDLGAAFETALTRYIHAISKWYTQLSRGLWWNLMMYLSAWSNQLIVGAFMLVGAEPPHLPNIWLLPLLLFVFFTIMTYGGRQVLFPTTQFKIVDAHSRRD